MKKLAFFLVILFCIPLLVTEEEYEWLRGGEYGPSIPTPK